VTPPPTPAPGTTSAYGPTATDIAALTAVNRIRRSQGLRELQFDARLFAAARDHSMEQARHGYMGHDSPDPARRTLAQRMAAAGYVGTVFAEVVGWGYQDAGGVVEGWMNSRDHREILIDPELTEAGFSRIGDYWTGNFGTPMPGPRRTTTPRPRQAPPSSSYSAPPSRPAPRLTAPAPRATQPPTSELFRRAQPAPSRPAPQQPVPARPPAQGG
jgi:hypothetical protein